MKKILLSFCILYSVFCTFTLAASSPVVQVVSYKEPLGLYFSLQWWGSGSIIDNQGHIITNNHVVDDGTGGISDDFAICMTDNPALPPRCHYTASVISRDAEADIAVLQIDATDIFGGKVDFGGLSTLPLDMTYAPTSGDAVIARGYPWVGANTITETQGIVSGTAQYNGYKYMKTDTLIAGGNSGGPLIHDGKMIGVNTFLIGGGYDPALGYSLLMSEAADIIDAALSETNKLQSNSDGFAAFLQKIDMFSVQGKIVDPLITFDLDEKYTVVSYIPSMTLEAQLSDGGTTSVASFGFYQMKTPRITDEKQFKKFLLKDMDPFIQKSITLNPVNIWGKKFYELVQKIDEEEEGNIKNEYVYISMLDETHSMVLYLSTPYPAKNTLDKIKKSVTDFIGNISFPSSFVFPAARDIVLPEADMSIVVNKNAAVVYDMSEYDGVLSYSILNKQDFVMVKNYMSTLWSYAQIAVFKNSFETEEKTIDQWIKQTTKYTYPEPTTKKILYKWYEWFLLCENQKILNDASKQQQDTKSCELILFVGDKKEYIISLKMLLEKSQAKNMEKVMQQYLDKMTQTTHLWETTLGAKNPLIGIYDDVGNQTEVFREALQKLVQYGVLQSRPSFGWDAPLTWRQYVTLYVWAVYHRRMTDVIDTSNPASSTFEKALSQLPIQWEQYAEDDDSINDLIRLLVSGWSLPQYDVYTILDFMDGSYQEDSTYASLWEKIHIFESEYFPNRVAPQRARFVPEFIVTYNPFTGLQKKLKKDVYNETFFRNNTVEKNDMEKVLVCEKSSTKYFSAECVNMRKQAVIEQFTYSVLTKWKAIEMMLENMDYALWDPSLKATKDESEM